MIGFLLLGVLQGLTEFLPVSSSGHLVLLQQWVEVPGDEVFFDLVLHVATLVPVLVFYRRDLARMVRDALPGAAPGGDRAGLRLALLVAAASVPTAALGLLFQDAFEALFADPATLTLTFGATGLLLFGTRLRRGEGRHDERTLPFWMALVLGAAQGLAIAPGISRSGTTIAVGLLLGLRREFAARLSFLMAIPAIAGAFVLKLGDVHAGGVAPLPVALGALAALVSGYAALVLLVRLVRRGDFSRFAWYVWALALACAALFGLPGA